MNCTWAACKRPATATIGGWAMCPPHTREHYEIEAPETRPSRNLDRIAMLHARGWTDAQIGRALGCHIESVRKHRVALGLRSNYTAMVRSRTRRSDAGKRKDVDAAAHRCGFCGEWVWARVACAACGVAA